MSTEKRVLFIRNVAAGHPLPAVEPGFQPGGFNLEEAVSQRVHSARGLAHSRTLSRVREPTNFRQVLQISFEVQTSARDGRRYRRRHGSPSFFANSPAL